MKLGLFSVVGFVAMAMTFLVVPEGAMGFQFGPAWAADNRYAHHLVGNKHLNIYHTWERGHVKQLSNGGLQWVPMRWGNKKNENWPRIKKLFKKHRFPYVYAYNEPDVASQSDYSPKRAATAFQKELAPLRRYGTKIGSPQICYNIKWLESFMRILKKKGGDVDFVAAHYYGSWNSIKHFKSYVQQLHKTFGKPVWITEFGITSSSKPSVAQAKKFMVEAIDFMKSTGYVKTAHPFGFFVNPPDSFGSGQVRVFKNGGSLTSLGKYYRHFDLSKRALDEDATPSAITRRHHALLKRLADADPPADEEFPDSYDGKETHCDDMCKAREAWLKERATKAFDIDEYVDGEDAEDDDSGIDPFTEADHLTEILPEDEDEE